MKKLLCLMFVVLCLAFSVGAEQIRPVNVTLNGENINCASYGQPATIIDGRTMVPLRAIFETLGADIVWDKNTRTVLSVKDETLVELTVGQKELIKNGKKTVIDVPAVIMNDRTLVPVRAVAEAFNVYVEWDKDSRTVILTSLDKIGTVSRKVKVESQLDEETIFGAFFFGMNLQECWNALSEKDEKKITPLSESLCEIEVLNNNGIYLGTDSVQNVKKAVFTFAHNYLYSVKIYDDSKAEPKIITDNFADIFLHGYPVDNQAKETAEEFLRRLLSFDMKSTSEVSTSPNSVRRMNVTCVDDVVSFTGFDKEKMTSLILSENVAKEYNKLADAVSDSVEKLVKEALTRCTFRIESVYGESEKKVKIDYTFSCPDVTFVMSQAVEKLEITLSSELDKALENNIESANFNDEQLQKLFSEVLAESLDKIFASLLDTCPYVTVNPKQPVYSVLVDGEWKVVADGETVEGILKQLKMFE